MEAEKVSDNNFKQFQISINGNQFEISSPYGEAHIREVERFLDEQITEVNQHTEVLGPTNLAYLVALNLADELLSLKNRQNEYEDMEKGLSHLCERLESVLSRPGMKDTNTMAVPDLSSKF